MGKHCQVVANIFFRIRWFTSTEKNDEINISFMFHKLFKVLQQQVCMINDDHFLISKMYRGFTVPKTPALYLKNEAISRWFGNRLFCYTKLSFHFMKFKTLVDFFSGTAHFIFVLVLISINWRILSCCCFTLRLLYTYVILALFVCLLCFVVSSSCLVSKLLQSPFPLLLASLTSVFSQCNCNSCLLRDVQFTGSSQNGSMPHHQYSSFYSQASALICWTCAKCGKEVIHSSSARHTYST